MCLLALFSAYLIDCLIARLRIRFNFNACFLARNRKRNSQPRKRLFGLLLPFGPSKALGGKRIPLRRFFHSFGFFFEHSEFPCNHGVASALE